MMRRRGKGAPGRSRLRHGRKSFRIPIETAHLRDDRITWYCASATARIPARLRGSRTGQAPAASTRAYAGEVEPCAPWARAPVIRDGQTAAQPPARFDAPRGRRALRALRVGPATYERDRDGLAPRSRRCLDHGGCTRRGRARWWLAALSDLDDAYVVEAVQRARAFGNPAAARGSHGAPTTHHLVVQDDAGVPCALPGAGPAPSPRVPRTSLTPGHPPRP